MTYNPWCQTKKRPRRLLFRRILCSHLYDGFIIDYFFVGKEKIYFKQAHWKCFHAILSSHIHRSQGPFLKSRSYWLTNPINLISSSNFETNKSKNVFLKKRKIILWIMRKENIRIKSFPTRNMFSHLLSCFYHCHFSGHFLIWKAWAHIYDR